MATTQKKSVVLIIDDNEINQIVIQSILNKHHIDCIMSDNGALGIQKATQYKPDVILLDIFMPNENGFDILDQIKHNTTIAHIPVYIFSILEDQTLIQKAYQSGAAGYIPKPFDMNDVVKELELILKQ